MAKEPAARVGDDHECPATEPKPHIGGLIQQGFGSVMIERHAAARAGDLATCIGATDVVAEGSATVKIGGMPAARRADKTLHQGRIKTHAASVYIGGGSVAPPGLADIVKAAAEIDRLKNRLRDRERKERDLRDFLDPRKEKSGTSRVWEILTPKPSDLPDDSKPQGGFKGAEKWADEIVKETNREWAQNRLDEMREGSRATGSASIS